MNRIIAGFGAAMLLTATATVPAFAATALAEVHSIDAKGVGKAIGTISFSDSKEGLIIKPRLAGLPAGPHGFHVHEKGSCASGDQNGTKVPGLAAGGHFDPEKSGKHMGPGSHEGHKGDLPTLEVNQAGKAMSPGLAPRLKVADLRGHAIIIHAGADNYADAPAALGGGGARIACAVVR